MTSAPIGSPPPSALAVGHRVGHDAGLLVGPQRAGAPHARTGPRRRSAPRRARRRPRARRAARSSRERVARRSRPAPARAAPPRSARRPPRASASAVGATATKPGHERRERRLLGLLRRRRQRAVGAPVEARRATDDDRRRRGLRLARELDRRLVGLGARSWRRSTLPPSERLGQPLRPAAAPARCRRGC